MYPWKQNKVLSSTKTHHRRREPRALRRTSKYGMLLSVLCYFGIDLFGGHRTSLRRAAGIFFTVLLHLSSLDYWFMSYVNFMCKWEEYQLVLSFVFSNTLSLVLWHALYWRRRSLRFLLRAVDPPVSPRESSLINWTVLLGVFAAPLLYSAVSVYLMNGPDPTLFYTFYTYGAEVANFTAPFNAYLFAKMVTSCLLDPVFTSCVILLYCLLCHRACRLLHGVRRKLSVEVTPAVATEYVRVCSVLEQLQSLFSLPSLLLMLVDTTSSFTILASAVLYAPEDYAGPLLAEIAFVFMTSALFLVMTIAFAAQVPLAMRGVRSALHRLHERVVLGDPAPSLHLIRALKGRKPIVLSGCEIVYFTRTTILTAFGTLLTYGLLIIQLK